MFHYSYTCSDRLLDSSPPRARPSARKRSIRAATNAMQTETEGAEARPSAISKASVGEPSLREAESSHDLG